MKPLFGIPGRLKMLKSLVVTRNPHPGSPKRKRVSSSSCINLSAVSFREGSADLHQKPSNSLIPGKGFVPTLGISYHFQVLCRRRLFFFRIICPNLGIFAVDAEVSRFKHQLMGESLFPLIFTIIVFSILPSLKTNSKFAVKIGRFFPQKEGGLFPFATIFQGRNGYQF